MTTGSASFVRVEQKVTGLPKCCPQKCHWVAAPSILLITSVSPLRRTFASRAPARICSGLWTFVRDSGLHPRKCIDLVHNRVSSAIGEIRRLVNNSCLVLALNDVQPKNIFSDAGIWNHWNHFNVSWPENKLHAIA